MARRGTLPTSLAAAESAVVYRKGELSKGMIDRQWRTKLPFPQTAAPVPIGFAFRSSSRACRSVRAGISSIAIQLGSMSTALVNVSTRSSFAGASTASSSLQRSDRGGLGSGEPTKASPVSNVSCFTDVPPSFR